MNSCTKRLFSLQQISRFKVSSPIADIKFILEHTFLSALCDNVVHNKLQQKLPEQSKSNIPAHSTIFHSSCEAPFFGVDFAIILHAQKCYVTDLKKSQETVH